MAASGQLRGQILAATLYRPDVEGRVTVIVGVLGSKAQETAIVELVGEGGINDAGCEQASAFHIKLLLDDVQLGLQVAAKLIVDETAIAKRFTQAGIGKIHHVFNAQLCAQLKPLGGPEVQENLIELFIKILAVPVGLAAAKQAVEP